MEFFLIIFFLLYDKEITFKKKNDGSLLLQEISFLQKGEKRILPFYKFFTKILNHLLEQRSLYGIDLEESLLIVKESLLKDLEFERKKKKVLIESLIQFFLILFFINLFFILFKFYLMIEISPIILIGVDFFLISIIGVFLFLINFFSQKIFNPIELLFEKILLYKSLFQSQLSLTSMNQLLDVASLKENHSLTVFKEKFFFLLERISKEGVYLEKDWKLLEQELKTYWEEKLLDFEKKLFLGRFLCIFLFFLPSYFFLVYVVFSSVLL